MKKIGGTEINVIIKKLRKIQCQNSMSRRSIFKSVILQVSCSKRLMGKGWEFIVCGPWVLMHLLLTSVQNILKEK